MRGLLSCFLYLAALGLCFFALGRALPKRWFRYDRFPYRTRAWERGGDWYLWTGVRRWKEIVPDMSKILPGLMPSKRLPGTFTPALLERMLQETCVAECVHIALGALGFGCVFLWPGTWGWAVSAAYCVLGNAVFVVIQRYNRPKLARLFRRMRQADESERLR